MSRKNPPYGRGTNTMPSKPPLSDKNLWMIIGFVVLIIGVILWAVLTKPNRNGDHKSSTASGKASSDAVKPTDEGNPSITTGNNSNDDAKVGEVKTLISQRRFQEALDGAKGITNSTRRVYSLIHIVVNLGQKDGAIADNAISMASTAIDKIPENQRRNRLLKMKDEIAPLKSKFDTMISNEISKVRGSTVTSPSEAPTTPEPDKDKTKTNIPLIVGVILGSAALGFVAGLIVDIDKLLSPKKRENKSGNTETPNPSAFPTNMLERRVHPGLVNTGNSSPLSQKTDPHELSDVGNANELRKERESELEKERAEVAKERDAIQADIRRNREILVEIKAEKEELFQNQNTEIQETIRVLEEAAAAAEERARQLETDLRQYESNLSSPGMALRREGDRKGTLLPEVHRDLIKKLTQLEELLESGKTHSILTGFASAAEDERQPVYELLEELDRRVYAPLPPAPFGSDADGKEVAWNTALLVAWQRQLHERATKIGLKRLEPAPGDRYNSEQQDAGGRDTVTTRPDHDNTVESVSKAGYAYIAPDAFGQSTVLRKASVRRRVLRREA